MFEVWKMVLVNVLVLKERQMREWRHIVELDFAAELGINLAASADGSGSSNTIYSYGIRIHLLPVLWICFACSELSHENCLATIYQPILPLILLSTCKAQILQYSIYRFHATSLFVLGFRNYSTTWKLRTNMLSKRERKTTLYNRGGFAVNRFTFFCA